MQLTILYWIQTCIHTKGIKAKNNNAQIGMRKIMRYLFD